MPHASRLCPICGRPARAATHPFCSKRCSQVDLGRWFRGDYALPTDDTPVGGDGEDQDGGKD